jgi:flagellar motor switch protein FliG
MFTFEDLARLDITGVQVVLRTVDKDILAKALKGASEPLKNLFLSNMSERAGKILREDMEAMGPLRLRDVEEAQDQIVVLTKNLADKGEVTITDPSSNEELVY